MAQILKTKRQVGLLQSTDGPVFKVGYAMNYSKGDYSLYGVAFGTPGPGWTQGIDFDLFWNVRPARFPDLTENEWYVKTGELPAGIGGYFHIDYRPHEPPTPIQLYNLVDMQHRLAWSYTGTTEFNQLNEVWLAFSSAPPVWTADGTVAELGQFTHAGAAGAAFHNGGVLIGTHVNNGVTYTLRQNSEFFTLLASSDVMDAKFSWKDAFDFMVYNGALTGSEWVSGAAPLFGIEPTRKDGGGATHGGKWGPKKLVNQISGNQVISKPTYLGVDLLNGLTFSTAAVTPTPSQPDVYGGNTALRLMEQTTDAAHSYFMPAASLNVPSRQCDVWVTYDIAPINGRVDYKIFVASEPFTDQLQTRFNTATFANSQVSQINGLTSLKREIIDLGNGVYRLFQLFRKAAGITKLYSDIQIGNGSVWSYPGDVTKGVTIHSARMSVLRPIKLSGTPAAAVTGVAYSWTPTVANGQDPLVFGSPDAPAGLSVNTSTGEVTGSLASPGTYNFTITATGANGSVGSAQFSITATSAPLTTFDPATKSASATLSESNRRLAIAGSNTGAKSTSTKSGTSGIYYAEFQYLGGGGGVGIMAPNGNIDTWAAVASNGIIYSTDQAVYQNGNPQTSPALGAWATNDTIRVLVNKATNQIRFGRNGTMSAVTYNIGAGDIVLFAQVNSRIRTELSQFSQSVPNWSTSGDAVPWN